jgi:hypothetical protein
MPETPETDNIPAEAFAVVVFDRQLAEDTEAAYGYWAHEMEHWGGYPFPGGTIDISYSEAMPGYPEFWTIRGLGIRESKP